MPCRRSTVHHHREGHGGLVSAAVRASVIARGPDVSPSAINRATLSWYQMSHLRRSELLAADQFSRTERRSA